MNKFRAFIFAIGGFVISPLTLSADFTSLYVFGDGVCTTTDSTGAPDYFGNRYCNGRVWIEVLADWQGIPSGNINNTSFFSHISGVFTGGGDPADDLLDDVSAFVAPPDVATSLFVIWVANADIFEFILINTEAGSLGTVTEWTTNIGEAVDNHESAITTLYNQGARTFILPLAVDITIAPTFNFSDPANNAFVRARAMEYNVALQTMVETLMPTLPGLKIHMPDTFSFFDAIIANPGDFDSVNPLEPPGTDPDLYAVGFDVLPLDFQGPGADYVFWDGAHPTARIQMYLADFVQQIITPVGIGEISETMTGGQVILENAPIGRAGILQGSDDLLNWALDANFTPTSTTHTETISTADDFRFFRAGFPVNWIFP